jgi:hypothetical protein
MLESEVKVLKSYHVQKQGALLTRLNNFDGGVVIPESETLKEVLCLGKRGAMFREPFSTLCSGGLKRAGSSMTKRIVKTL